jgi:phasin family protein
MNGKPVKTAPVKAPAAKKAEAPKVAAPAAKPVAATPVAKPAAASAAPAPKPAAPVEAPQTAVESAPIQNKPAAAPVEPVTKGPTMTNTTDTAKAFAQDAQNRATALFSDFNARTKAAVERSTKLVEELNEFNKGNIEALVESGRVAAKAAETLGQQAAETARKNFETTTAALKTFASVKTPTEFFQLQSDYARNAFDSMIAETSKNSETLLKLAGDVFQPISNRFAVAAEKMKAAA